MQSEDGRKLTAILQREVVPALGCTEPISVALAAAQCRIVLNKFPTGLQVWVSGNLFKNGMGVGVPGTGMTGLPIAAALGAVAGDPQAGLEVLKNIESAHLEQAKALLPSVTVAVKTVPDALYVEVVAQADGETAKVVICTDHTRIILIEKNGVALPLPTLSKTPDQAESQTELSLPQIFEYANEVPFEEIAFILSAASLNQALADEGLQGYGLQVGRILTTQIERKLLSDDLMTRAMRFTAAASDARMGGAMLPAMSNSGSGNQGITATIPVVVAAKMLEVSEEKLARALVMSHLIAIYIKSYQNKLSALCAASTAAMGAGAAITWLLGGGLPQISYCVRNMVGDVSGIICDGAGSGCAMKVSTSTSAAIKSALLAVHNCVLPPCEGIVDEDIEQVLKNLGRLSKEGMRETDQQIIQIMRDKHEPRLA